MTKKKKLVPVSNKTVSKGSLLYINNLQIPEKGFAFSFGCFDRNEDLFNLGANTDNGIVSSDWFIKLFDCLKEVSTKTVPELKQSSKYHLHPVDWNDARVKKPIDADQLEYVQFSIDKSHGRVIGILFDKIFFVKWLDPHHNLTDSPHYQKSTRYKAPKID